MPLHVIFHVKSFKIPHCHFQMENRPIGLADSGGGGDAAPTAGCVRIYPNWARVNRNFSGVMFSFFLERLTARYNNLLPSRREPIARTLRMTVCYHNSIFHSTRVSEGGLVHNVSRAILLSLQSTVVNYVTDNTQTGT